MVTLILIALAAPPAGFAGRAVAVSGDVAVTRDARVPLARGDYLLPGDVVSTGEDGNIRLLMRDKSVLALGANSRLKISAYDVEPTSRKRRARLTMLVGRLWAFVTETVNPDASYEVETGNAVAGVRGTELVCDVAETGSSEVTVIKGRVDLAADAGRETLVARERGAVAGAGIALSSTSEEAIADIRRDVRPEQDLDTAKAEKRLAASRKKTEVEGPTGARLEDERLARDDPGTGDAVFEDAGGVGVDGSNSFDRTPTGGIDARVRVRVEVRP